MISYKRDVLLRQSLSEVKMDRGSPICERVRKKIVEYFKNNVPQRQITKALQISSSTLHNISKRFRETGEISVCKGPGRRPLLDAHGLLQMPSKALSCKKEAICEHGPEVPSCPVGQGSFKMDCFKEEKVFYGQKSPNLTFLLEITDAVSSGLKRRETFQCVISVQFKSQHLWWYGGA